MQDLAFMTVSKVSDLIQKREVSPVEITESVLQRIDQYNDHLKSYITVCGELARKQAHERERELSRGCYRGPLHGIPIAHKDVLYTRAVRTTAHSRALDDVTITEDAQVVVRLEAAGMVMLGKTNTNEFANGGTEHYGTPRLPWDARCFSGGSSAGSANAVAAGLAPAATGSDTAGSIRAPASFCGVVGLKATHGLVPVDGLIPLSWSMDYAGPLARSVADIGLLMDAMAPHPKTSNWLLADCWDLTGMSIGIPRQHFFEGLDSEVERVVRRALDRLNLLGADLRSVDLPRAGDLAAASSVILAVEAFASHAGRLREKGDLYGTRARRHLSSGAFYSGAEYEQAGQIRTLWMQELAKAMADLDLIVTPTVSIPPVPISVEETRPPDTSWGTRHFNLSGHPAISIPCGFTESGHPVGLQMVAHWHDETTLLQAAMAYERAFPWHEGYLALKEVI